MNNAFKEEEEHFDISFKVDFETDCKIDIIIKYKLFAQKLSSN